MDAAETGVAGPSINPGTPRLTGGTRSQERGLASPRGLQEEPTLPPFDCGHLASRTVTGPIRVVLRHPFVDLGYGGPRKRVHPLPHFLPATSSLSS